MAKTKPEAPQDPLVVSMSEILNRKQPRTEGARVRLDDGTVATLTFQAIGRQAFDDLKTEHPPTPDQRAKMRKALTAAGMNKTQIDYSVATLLDHNPDTFPPALLAASALEPAMTLNEATEMWTSPAFSKGELAAMLETVEQLNIDKTFDLGNG